MRKKVELYKKEQDDIIEKLIQLLELDDQMSTTLYELDNNKIKTDAIMKMIPTIRKFFSSSKITGISEPDKLGRPWLSLLRQLVKGRYNMFSCDYRFQIEGDENVIRTKKYIFKKMN
jgi:hypothetical protein